MAVDGTSVDNSDNSQYSDGQSCAWVDDNNNTCSTNVASVQASLVNQTTADVTGYAGAYASAYVTV